MTQTARLLDTAEGRRVVGAAADPTWRRWGEDGLAGLVGMLRHSRTSADLCGFVMGNAGMADTP